MLPLHEIDVLGVLVSPFALCVPLALLVSGALWFGLRRVAAGSSWLLGPGIELSLLVASLSGFVLLLGRF
jgi:surface polysaccharide O-acyltransferase-like enzyme